MSQVEWQQVKELFYSALNQPPAERSDFLDSACGKNGALRSEVEVLLESYESGFLESPVLGSPSPREPAKPLFEPGRTFSHYSILKLLGRGGMGEVYLANDVKLDRLTAIKIIHNDSGFGDQAAGRLVREARAAAKLDHPNICSVYEVGETDGQPFIAMQYVEGDMLDTLIEREAITLDDAVSYARQIAAGLAKAHSYGIVHRDIKPSNIIIDSRKHLKVLDFGLAKDTLPETVKSDLSGVGLIAGTITYMSPEHARGQEISGQTDIWSLGVVFYQMLTGRLPFRGETKADLISAVLNDGFEAPADLPAPVNNILTRALQKDTERRYHTIEELDADLAKLSAGTLARPTGLAALVYSARAAVARGLPAKERPIWRFVVPALVVLALAVGIGIWRNGAAGAPPVPFAAMNAGNWQAASLYDVKRQRGGAITDLRFSPEGNNIAFSLTANGLSAIHVQPVVGSVPSRLTDGMSIDQTPVWAPDGQRIAYLSNREGKRAIWSVAPTGGDPTLLAHLDAAPLDCRLAKWSNDGKRIFFEYGDGPREVDLESGTISPLALAGITGKIERGFEVSPDESRLLVVAIENHEENLWVKSLERDDARQLAEPYRRHGTPSWLPDSQTYAYSSDHDGNNQIYIRSLDDSESRRVTFANTTAAHPVVSPDGKSIVYVQNTDQANLFSLDSKSGKETAITANVNMQLFPSVSSNGRVAYQTVNDPAKIREGVLRVDSLTPNAGDSAYALTDSGCCVKWSPSGNEVFFARASATDLTIWKSDVVNRKETQITTVGISIPGHTIAPFDFQTPHFDLSPNGSSMAFVSKQSGQHNVWTVNTKDRDERMVTDLKDGIKALAPLWSPDGRRIAYIQDGSATSAPLSSENRVAIYDGGNTTIVAEFQSPISLLSWATDNEGVYVAVFANGQHDIYLVSANGSNEIRNVMRLPDASRFSLRISPDRASVAFAARRENVDNLYIVPMVGSAKPKRVTSNEDPTLFYSGVTWTPDSSRLVYSKQTGGMQISLISNKQEEN